HRLFIAVIEFIRKEVPSLSLNDDVRHFFHFSRQGQVWNILKIGVLGANLIAITKHRAEKSLAKRLKHHDSLASREHRPTEADHFLLVHGVSNDGESLFSHALAGRDIVWRFEIAGVDFCTRHEFLDIDRVRARSEE